MSAVKHRFSLSMLSLAMAMGAHAAPVEPVKDLLLPLCVNDECGVIDENGSVLVPFSKNNTFDSGDFKSTYAFVEKKKLGLKNRAGAVVVAPQYDSTSVIADGLVAVMKDKLWGVVDLQGHTLIEPDYDDVTYCEKADAIMAQKGGQYFLFDKAGHPFKDVVSEDIIYQFDKPGDVASGFGKWLKVDLGSDRGSYLFNAQTGRKTKAYKRIFSVKNGYVQVENDMDQRTLLNADGQEIFPFRFDSSLGYPNAGLIPFKDKEKFGFLDMNGRVAIPAQYDFAGSAGKAGALVGMKSSDGGIGYGVIDRKGAWIVEPSLTNAGGGDFLYDTPQLPIGQDGKMGVYDLDTLQWVVAPQYEWASTSGHFIAAGDAPPGDDADANWGEENSRKPKTAPAAKTMGLFDHDGRVLLPRKYRMFNSPFAFGADDYTVAWMKQGENQSLISPEGKEIIDMAWPKYHFVEPGFIVGGQATQGGGQTWEAYYDVTGELLLQIKTDACDQQQILTGDNRVVWPLKAKVCKKRAKH